MEALNSLKYWSNDHLALEQYIPGFLLFFNMLNYDQRLRLEINDEITQELDPAK